MLLTRQQVFAAVRVGALLAKASDPAATVPESDSYRSWARTLAGRIPNGPGVLKALDKETGNDQDRGTRHGDD